MSDRVVEQNRQVEKVVRVAQLPGLRISSRMFLDHEQWVTADSGELEFQEPDGFKVAILGEPGELTEDDMIAVLVSLYDQVEAVLLKKVFDTREKLRAMLQREHMDNLDI